MKNAVMQCEKNIVEYFSFVFQPIQRREFHSDALVIPKNLQKKLPFSLKPKTGAVLPASEKKRQPKGRLIQRHSAVLLEPKESKVRERL